MSATKRDAPDSLKNDSPKRPKLSQSPVSSVKKKKNKITFAQEIALNRESAAPGTDVSANGSVLKCAVCRLLGTRFSSYPSQSDHKTDADPRFALSSGSDSTQVAVVQCHVCYVSVHTVCYGVREVKGRGLHWRCDRCQDDPSHVTCELCPNLGGAYKSAGAGAGGGTWVHAACAVWVPETRFSNWPSSDFRSSEPGMEPPVVGIDEIEKTRHKLKCKVCNARAEQGMAIPRRPRGACIQCSNGQCKIAAHVTCALESLPTYIEWSKFPSDKSLMMYCQDRHVPTWMKDEIRLKAEKQLAPLAPGDNVRANRGDDVWVRGTVETAETRPYCWVKLASDGEEYRLGVDEIELHPDEAEPIAPGKRVILNWEEGGQDEGTVGTVEEEVVYTVLGVGGETIADLTRSRLCPVDDWLTQRPAGAVGDDEQPLDETDDEGTGTPREGEGEGEGLNSTVVDPRFIIERTQRPAAAKAVEETSKLLQDEPLHPPVTTATTPAADKKKPAAEKKAAGPAQAKERDIKPKVTRMTSCWDVLQAVKGVFDAWVGQRLDAKAEKARMRAELVKPSK